MDLEAIAYVIDGKTGERYCPGGHPQSKGRAKVKRFIRGPIPIQWVQRVNCLSKSAGALAWGIAYLHGLEGKDTFRLRPVRLRELGISRSAKDRGLAALEREGLVCVLERGRGCSPLVKVMWELSKGYDSAPAMTSSAPAAAPEAMPLGS